MDINAALFSVRCTAMAYAMQTATPGEAAVDVVVRARLYAHFMAEPLLDKQSADDMGAPPTQARH